MNEAKPPHRKPAQTKRYQVQEYSALDAMIAHASRAHMNTHWARVRCDTWQDSENFVYCLATGVESGVTVYAPGYCPRNPTPGAHCHHRGAHLTSEDLLAKAVHKLSLHIEVFGIACDMRGSAEQVVCEFAGFDHQHGVEVVNATLCPRLPSPSNECVQFPEPKE